MSGIIFLLFTLIKDSFDKSNQFVFLARNDWYILLTKNAFSSYGL